MYLIYFFLAFFLSLILTVGVRYLMRRFGIVDEARKEDRKIKR